MKVLLVEFAIVDRFQCAVEFPYIQGSLRRLGLSTLMVRIGLRSGRTFVSEDNHSVAIPSDAIPQLKARLREFLPDAVLFSHKPDAETIRALCDDQGCRIGFVTGDNRVENALGGVTASLAEWLSTVASPKHSLDTLSGFPTPGCSDFSFVPLNRMAKTHRPLPHILCSDECRYRAKLSENPVYRNVDIGGAIHHSRCTFCVQPPSAFRKEVGADEPLVRLRQYLPVAAQTTPWQGHKPRYRLIGHSIIRNIKKVCEHILELDLPSADYLLNCRVDDIVRYKEKISEALSLFSGTDNQIFLCLIGIENFCDDELLRFNKGITAHQIMEMLLTLHELRQQFPDHLDYHTYGGLSTILYTPWTTLDNVEFNLRLVELFGLHSLCGKLLTSRLRLYQELPLYQLALKDGLIIDQYDDVLFNTAFANFYPAEVPWKFCDERVELFNRVVSNCLIRPDGQNDPVDETTGLWFNDKEGEGYNSIFAALTLIEQLKKSATVPSVESFVNQTPTGLAESGFINCDLSELEYGFEFKEFLFRQNPSFAGKIEYVGRENIASVQRALRRFFGSRVNLRTCRIVETDDFVHICYGYDPRTVQKLVSLSEGAQMEAYSRENISEIGKILGYPPCCVESFARWGGFELKYNEWLHVHNMACAKSDEIEPSMNPFYGYLSYVPCSLHCEASLSLVRKFESFHQRKGLKRQRAELQSPVLYLLRHPGTFARLDGASIRNNGGKYDMVFESADLHGKKTLLECLALSDRISISEGRIYVYQGEKRLHSYIMTAAIWWYKKSFHPLFWLRCFDLAHIGYSMGDVLGNNCGLSPAFSSIPCSSEQKIIQQLVTRFADLIEQKAESRLLDFSFGENRVELVFTRRARKIHLEIAPSGSVKNPFVSGHRYSMNYNRDTLPDEQLAYLASLILHIIESYFEKRTGRRINPSSATNR